MKHNSILENIPDDWEIMRLSEAILINPKRDLKKGATAKKVSMDNLEPFNKKIKNFEVEIYSGGSKFINEDILMARITPCLENGKTAFVDILAEGEIAFGSTEFIVFSGLNTKTVSDYVYYLAISPRFRLESIKSMTGTSGRQRVQIDSIEKIQIPVPPLPEQKAIAKVLSDLDDKIELNNEMNKTLEEIGQALFKRWFIDFEFPDENGNPYRSSGGEMVYSEDLGKEIPKGWKVKKISQFGNIICGKTPPKSVKTYFGGEIPFIKIPDMHGKVFITETEDSLTDEGLNYQRNKTLLPNSLCVSCIATVGLVSITSKISQTNQQINSIMPHERNVLYFLYYQFKDMKDYLMNLGSGGSATLNINTNIFSEIKILMPPSKYLDNFNNSLNSLFQKLLSNLQENKSLEELRDSLLPKLMSGEIRVPLEETQ